MNEAKDFHFFALAASGEGLSGSDRIFIELARNWSKKYPVTVHLWKEGRQMCARQDLKGKNLSFHEVNLGVFCRLGFFVCYIARIIAGTKLGLTLNLDNSSKTYVYSTNDFWMDLIPGWLLKLRFSRIIWISSFYLAAPSPFRGFDETGKSGLKLPSIKLILYWIQQQPMYILTRIWADYVFVTSEPDTFRFPKQNRRGKVIVVRGGVKLDDIEKFRVQHTKHRIQIYDAVFQGRFHPQKGVIELIDIWKKVVDKQSLRVGNRNKPGPILAMMGDGPLMESVKFKIKSEKLERNIKLFGYVYDGAKKYRIFANSKMVLHPAIYDSGGMAAAEAMAFGIPAVGFDLKAYKTYYPNGMVKVEKGSISQFAKTITKLLKDNSYREKMGKEALHFVEERWSWKKRSSEILKEISDE